ncbi:DUF11 domain-containing protein [Erythrobacter sp. SCSIO 43205]|uniref:SdrD B-like domain-containing protein n=1 Tax=Erythrobacter sp. SCSIO 43205 TaxID=2779361 RepID=UPI001CA8DACB|nr:SdrD B-like domain-containing protein [Erythrobacter sp. SCSIO 43205]UAB78787.1 DUF11 domain-containing protein [Erythrobacter sp. SCSIO 43205]
MARSSETKKHKSSIAFRTKMLLAATALGSTSAAIAAPPLVINDVAAPTTVGSGQGERAIWTNGGTVGGVSVDIVAVVTEATVDHSLTTTSNRPSITSSQQDNVFIEWRLYEAGTYDIATDSGGVPVVADIHVQINDIDGPNNEQVFLPVCQGDIEFVRIDRNATTGRAFGTVAGRPDIFSLIGDQNYNQEPISGLEVILPDLPAFEMGRTADNGFLIRLDNPTYSEFDTLDFACADFTPPIAVDDSQEGTPGVSATVSILRNDSAATDNNNAPNNNSLVESEFARASISLVAPVGATNITNDIDGDIASFTVPGEGDWSYDEISGDLTFTPDPSFVGEATQIDYVFDNALGITSNTATVTIWYPGLGLVKSAVFNDENADGYGQVGETITYTYQARAYGREALGNITLAETGFTGNGTTPTPAFQSGDTNGDNLLDLSEVWTYTATYALVADDLGSPVANSATLSGQTAGGTLVQDVSDSTGGADGDGSGTSAPGPNNDDPTTSNPANKPIAASDDSQPATIFESNAAPNAFNVLGNDTLDGAATNLGEVTLNVTSPASDPGVTLDPASGEVSVAAGTPAGTYTIGYEICEIGNPNNCASATATVVVSAATGIAATDDTPAPVQVVGGGTNIINVLANDDLGGSPPDIADIDLTVTSPAADPGVSLDTASGNVSVAPGTPAGTYTIGYQFCESANPTNCASASVTVVVESAPIDAQDDTPAPVNGANGGSSVVDAFANDTLNGAPVDPASVNATITSPATPASPGSPVPVMNPATGLVDVPASTPAGTYTIGYQICEAADPTNCATANVTIVVQAAPITADADAAPDVTAGAGNANAINAYANDTLNGAAVNVADITGRVTAPATPASPGASVPVLDPATGIVSVANDVPAGSYTIGYEICENLNPSNCASNTISINVVNAPIVAGADNPGPVNGTDGGDDIINAFDNDTLNGSPVDLADITASVLTPATPATPGAPVPELDPATGLVDVPPGTPAGTYTITYEICENANPTNCASSSVTVIVEAGAITAVPDTTPTVIVGVGDPSAVNAYDNDTFNSAPVDPADITGRVTTPATPASPGAPVPVLDPATGVVAVASDVPAGTYVIGYEICEDLNPTNCASSTITVVVEDNPILASDDAITDINGRDGFANVLNAFDGDTLGGAPATSTTATISVAPGSSVPAELDFDPATGFVSVPAATPEGTYSFDYQLCETINPSNCSIATISVGVAAAPIVVGADTPPAVIGATGGGGVINVFDNDTLGGEPVDPADIIGRILIPATPATPGSPVPVVDPSTGLLDIPPGTPSGTYTITYEICEVLNPTNCGQSTVTVEVISSPIVVVGDAPDPVNGADGAQDIVNVFDNDLVNGQPVDLDEVTATVISPAQPVTPGAPVPVLDPATGLIDVPSGTPAGTYEIEYELCEDLNPDNCATGTATVVVEPPVLIAEDDTLAPVRNGVGSPNAGNVFDNDTLNDDPIDPSLVTLTLLTPPADPGITLDPATGVIAIGADVPPGTYELTYQLCENLNPSNCDTATIGILVEEPRGNIAGTVFTDDNVNDVQDASDEPRAGFIVEVVRDGEVVASTTTNPDGSYVVTDVLSGEGYEVVFRRPDTQTVYSVIPDVTVLVAATQDDVDLPIDPSGVLYDAVSRTPVAGASVTLVGENGNTLPDVCFIDPSQAVQTTGSDGEYQFDVVPGAASQCPNSETVYTIVITPPTGFAVPSTVIAPLEGPFDPSGLSSPVMINPSVDVPTDATPPYYFSFALQSGDPDIVFNHIPLDPFLTRNPLVVTKTSTKRTANVGDIVPYQITVQNAENVQRADVDVIDILPSGLRYIEGSGFVNGVAQEPETDNAGRELVWRDQVIPGNGAVTYSLSMVIGAGVSTGEKVNTGVAENGATGEPVSNRGTAVIQITPSSVFDCSELIGKVFEDANYNGYQDEGEPGVPAARLATVNGQLVTTDEHGRYHIACAAVPNARIGSNYVLKLDTRSLPLGWDVTTDNPRSIRLTRGKFGELNFGVAPANERTSGRGSPVKPTEGGE